MYFLLLRCLFLSLLFLHFLVESQTDDRREFTPVMIFRLLRCSLQGAGHDTLEKCYLHDGGSTLCSDLAFVGLQNGLALP